MNGLLCLLCWWFAVAVLVVLVVFGGCVGSADGWARPLVVVHGGGEGLSGG